MVLLLLLLLHNSNYYLYSRPSGQLDDLYFGWELINGEGIIGVLREFWLLLPAVVMLCSLQKPREFRFRKADYTEFSLDFIVWSLDTNILQQLAWNLVQGLHFILV